MRRARFSAWWPESLQGAGVFLLFVFVLVFLPGIGRAATTYSQKVDQYEVHVTATDSSWLPGTTWNLTLYLDSNSRGQFIAEAWRMGDLIGPMGHKFWGHPAMYTAGGSGVGGTGTVTVGDVLHFYWEPAGTCCTYSNGELDFSVVSIYPPLSAQAFDSSTASSFFAMGFVLVVSAFLISYAVGELLAFMDKGLK